MINEWFKQIQEVEEDSGVMENNVDAILGILASLDWDTDSYDFPAISTDLYLFPAFTLSREEIKEIETDLTAYYNGHISFGSIVCWIDGSYDQSWRSLFALAAYTAHVLETLPEWDINE